MKCSALSVLLAFGSALGASAQGTVAFANNSTCPVCLYQVGFVPTGSSFQAELMFAPDGTPASEFENTATRIGAAASFFPSPGIFSGGTRTVQSISPAGGFGLFQVRVWETSRGSDYWSSALNSGRVGKSAILRVDTGNPNSVPPGTPGSLIQAGLVGFTVGVPLGGDFVCVPEPAIVPFAVAMGAAVLLVRRSRCRSKGGEK